MCLGWAKFFEVAIGYDYLGQGISNRGDYTITTNTVFTQTIYYTIGRGAKATQIPATNSYLASRTNNPFGGSSGSQSLLSFLGIAKFQVTVAGHVWVPYVGVGPGVAWTSIGNHTATNAALVVEPGVRFLINKNWFVSAAYRYTNTAPTIAGVRFPRQQQRPGGQCRLSLVNLPCQDRSVAFPTTPLVTAADAAIESLGCLVHWS